MRTLAIAGLAALMGAVSPLVGCAQRPTTPYPVAALPVEPPYAGATVAPSADRALDCRNPQDAPLCAELDTKGRSGRSPYGQPAPQYPAPPSPSPAYSTPAPPRTALNEALPPSPIAPVKQADAWQPRPGEAYYPPSTYCEWNRSGLPAKQQKVCSDLDQQNAAIVARIQANASPALLEYEAIMTPIYKSFFTSYYAALCGMRSKAVLEKFADASRLISQQEASRLHLSAVEVNAAYEEAQRGGVPPQKIAENLQEYCRTFANSSKLEQLDAMERKLTGNYH
jgi:hypothetical protein